MTHIAKNKPFSGRALEIVIPPYEKLSYPMQKRAWRRITLNRLYVTEHLHISTTISPWNTV